MIFYELYRAGYIKISRVILAFDKTKRRAYCERHVSYYHATNNCNVFGRQIQ